MTSEFGFLLNSLIFYLPLLILWAIGLIMTVANKDKNPKAAMLLITAMILLIIEVIISLGFSLFIPKIIMSMGVNYGNVGWIYALRSFLTVAISIVAWVLIFMVLFGKYGPFNHKSSDSPTA
jgi:hypothetical protein